MADIIRLDQNTRRSRAVIHGDTVYLAGQTADDRAADLTGQTRQVLAKIDEMLAAAGTDKSKVLNITIWLADMADFAAMNAVYDAWVVQGSTPARCCGQVALAAPDIRVEIMAIAAR
ncbi:RidA family protein [Muricoccus radiodurans]|uniref:RidA family protein n=1 Tax=Muricoccus radiodurans TaxID=2231721 RepID=UPI003CE697C4